MHFNYQLLLNQNFQDLNPLFVGEAAMEPSESVGPKSLNVTMIHFVVKGRGTLHSRNQLFPVHAGQAFLILPGETVFYQADEEDPWEYQWVGFSGALSHDFSVLPPVFDVPENTLRFLKDLRTTDENLEYHMASDLFLLHARLIRPQNKTKDYVQLAIDYIRATYMQKLTVEEIARHLGLNRSYLSKIFSKRTNTTIQNYIMDVRYEESKRYLSKGFSVIETAAACGYTDPSNFSKLFKAREGMSPKHWQKYYSAKIKTEYEIRKKAKK